MFNANGNEINILDMQNERTYDRQTQKSYVGIGANLGIPMIGSLQQVWEAGRGLRHARHKEEYLGSGLKTATGTAGLISSLGGNFVNSGLSLNYSNNRSSQHREESTSVGSNLYVAGGVEYNGSNLHTRGLNIQNDGDTVYNLTGSIIKEAGVSTVKENSSSRGYGITISQDTFNSAGQVQNVLKPSTRVITPSISDEKSRTAGTYYNQGQDVTKGNSHYNVAGDVKVTGVDVKTGSVSGTVGGKMTVESVQDKVDSESRGYSLSYGIGIGNHTVVRNGKPVQANGVYTSSIGAGYSTGNATQRTTNTVAGFAADSGILDVKGTVRQVGSIIDGNFTLNSGGYEHEDLKDVDKSRNIGINMTFTPGVTEIYRNGRLTGEATGGVAIGTRLNYSETDYVAKVKATVGEVTGITVNGEKADLSGVNRDKENMMQVIRDKKVIPVEYNLGTEYWLTNYSREKFNSDKVKALKNLKKYGSEVEKRISENFLKVSNKENKAENLSNEEVQDYLLLNTMYDYDKEYDAEQLKEFVEVLRNIKSNTEMKDYADKLSKMDSSNLTNELENILFKYRGIIDFKNNGMERLKPEDKNKVLLIYDNLNARYKSPFNFTEKNVTKFDKYFKENNDYKKISFEWKKAYENNDMKKLISIKKIYANSYKNFMNKEYGIDITTDFIIGHTGKNDIGNQLSPSSIYRKMVESLPDFDGKIDYRIREDVHAAYNTIIDMNEVNIDKIKTFDEFYNKQKHESIVHISDQYLHIFQNDLDKVKKIVEENDLENYGRIIRMNLRVGEDESKQDYFLYFFTPKEVIGRYAETK